ncbi:ATP-grasp domain-containing protein [Chloroflexus sp.]|uniref:ATP-grasp domain-containing protein n=1 Tax=Chloroflexus sp. TaxID=1904827 RepID=UPI00298F06A7|nr:ATP-grasp domain-containing protein [Chloroflexus sp.]MDW8405247.1 ATP-grasp domain-containing protein [Chloroflexus sp.]
MPTTVIRPHLLLLTTPSSYRLPAFLAAAERINAQATVAEDTPPALARPLPGRLLIDFSDRPAALRAIRALHADQPLTAILPVDDSGVELAALACAALGLPFNRPEAAAAARDKHLMRQLFARAGVPSPAFRLCTTDADLATLAQTVPYPCVVKPLRLNGSRGVIRADNPDQFVAAALRLAALLDRVEGMGTHEFLVEEFIPGFEVALEGLIDHGQVQVLALFDKPDPLDGPFFEETIYVTPSRLPESIQTAIREVTTAAAQAVGLEQGPLHAELRINERGPWMIELANRSIGGLCSRTLRFGTDTPLEELILRQAAGLPIESLSRSGNAGGVMMIPIPQAGILRGVEGIEAARAIPGIESIDITAPLNYPLTPLPEGDSYLGFIFARGPDPATVEAALRAAHAQLRFTIVPAIELTARQR